jgi:hypothetical protein
MSLRCEFTDRFKYFTSFEEDLCLITALFSFNIEKAAFNVQMELFKLQCDSVLKEKYSEVGIPGFYIYLPTLFLSRCVILYPKSYQCFVAHTFVNKSSQS